MQECEGIMGDEPVRKFFLKQFKVISHAISTYEDLTLLIKHLSEGTSRTFEAKGCSILLLDERENELFHVSSYGISEEYLKKGPIMIDDKYSAFVRGEPVYIEDMRSDLRAHYQEAAKKEGIVSMLSIPIKYRNVSIGLIRIYLGEQRGFNEDDVEALGILAEHLGLVIENNGMKNFIEKIKMAMESLPLRMLEGL